MPNHTAQSGCSKSKGRRRMMAMLLKWMIRCLVALVAGLSLTGLTYRMIGLWNRRYGSWTTVFFCYAGSQKFVDSYGLPGLIEFFRWRPTPIGVMRQNGEWGLVVASAMSERDFLDPQNAAQFKALQKRLQRIADLTSISQINVAGILPGVLKQSSDIVVTDTRAVVVDAVDVAVGQMLASHLPPQTQHIIVLGGAGRIGSGVVARLQGHGLQCHSIDIAHDASMLPTALTGQSVLLVDIARKGAIANYIPQMWPEIVVLNEVFPATSRKLVTQMHARGVQVFHLAGVAGRIFPPLPHGYENAIPCCAARPVDGPMTVRITPL